MPALVEKLNALRLHAADPAEAEAQCTICLGGVLAGEVEFCAACGGIFHLRCEEQVGCLECHKAKAPGKILRRGQRRTLLEADAVPLVIAGVLLGSWVLALNPPDFPLPWLLLAAALTPIMLGWAALHRLGY